MIDYLALIDKYYATQPELKHILLVHSMQVRDRALRIVDNHPEWRTADPKELLREIMKKFQGRLAPQHVTGWIEHIQDRLGK